ncbi:unnamed protein product [Moneuplotes crassus]|uniref:YbaK/aminoacyl-tRNA synthetase-associated domain-containing protein n=1 Tax=Euplotes crassus TaxID=5936 RepID=A0AAD1XZI3_EUPCR|nr:unnamed protein product [Moneuplotes crassus]
METEKDKDPAPAEEVKEEVKTDEPEEDPATFNKVEELLKENEVEYTLTIHKPTKTSQESADVRGATLASGAKAMFIVDHSKKFNLVYFLCVMSAARKMNWKRIKGIVGTKKLRLATVEEVFDKTGCVSGAVPPFGKLFDAHTYVDNSLIEQGDTINFNAGLRTLSINMKTEDYVKVEDPKLCNFVQNEEPKTEES